MSETTSKFPDLVNLIKELCKLSASTFILDSEVSSYLDFIYILLSICSNFLFLPIVFSLSYEKHILSQVVAIERKNGNKLMSFQELSSRERGGRGSAVSLENIKVHCFSIYDGGAKVYC